MMKTYRLAKQVNHDNGNAEFLPFGPLFTLTKAESYAQDIRKAGFSVFVINTLAL